MSHSNINYATDSRNKTHHSHITGSFNYNHSFNNDIVLNVSNIGVTDERSEILSWLSPIEPRIRHQDIRTRRADRVGEWLLETNEFQRWCDGTQEDGSEHAALFCCGDPAVGKTYLSSLVVDRLCDKAREQNIAVACFYVDFAAREVQSPTNMLGSLLKQIVAGLERIPDEICWTFQNYKKVIGGRGLRVPEIVKMLQTVASLKPTYICIDALDESTDGDRAEVLESMRQILEKSPSTRIFLAGRGHIRCEIERYLAGRAATLFVKPSRDDILGYIRMRLSKGASLVETDSCLEAEIIESIAENIPKTFLLLSLTMDAILGETTAYGRRQKLRAMTDGLDLKGVYGATLERIRQQGGEKARLGVAALMWISHSERLLQLDELSHALAIEIGSADLNPKMIPSVETLLSCCLGLVIVDRESSTVRLIHFTLQEYLHNCADIFGPTHSVMAKTCLTYLNFQTIKDISSTRFAPPHSTTFLKYSSLYWGVHARREAIGEVVPLALKLFSQIENHIFTKLLLANLISRTGRYNGDIPINGLLTGFTGLHCASVFGIVEIASTLMEQPSCDLNQSDFLGITPFIWAIICGQEEVIQLLLEQPTLILDKPDNFFRRTPLSWAAVGGHEGIVRLLLGRASSNPDGTDGWWGKTPRLINIVLGRRYVNPNKPDIYGQTPILLAAEEGHEWVVKLLLERKDVKPDLIDGYGRTPLFCATSKGRKEVVKLLLERDGVKIDRLDKGGQTLLLSAVESGYDGVVELLLGRRDVNPNMPNKAGQMALPLALEKEHIGVMKLLLELEDINPNVLGKDGLMLFSWAAKNGHDGLVELLLRREDISPDMPDNDGRTPLSRAAEKGHGGVLRMLLERKDVNPDLPDNRGRTPLLWAAVKGHDGVVKSLLEREEVNINMPDNGCRTPLSWASECGHDAVVKLLLGREDISADMPDNGGRTPLSLATDYGHEGVVKLLLEREDVNPDMPDNGGRTPLAFAAGYGHEGVVKQLLAREDVSADMPDNGGRTPLSMAVNYGHEEVVELLLKREDVNPNMPNDDGRTPLSLAADYGHEGVVKMLLAREGVNPSIPNNCGRTPLSWAAENGHDGIAKLLLGLEDVNPNMPDTGGRTPLAFAARYGHEGVVEQLLRSNGINPNAPDEDDHTPLSLARQSGCEGVLKLLQPHEPPQAPIRISPRNREPSISS